MINLGGFCPLFDPFYYEDVEVSLQALLRGWDILFVPGSRVKHEHGSSTCRRRLQFSVIPLRNYHFLHWLLLDSPDLWRAYWREERVRLSVWPFRGRVRYALTFFWAATRWRSVRRWRNERARGVSRSVSDALRAYAPAEGM